MRFFLFVLLAIPFTAALKCYSDAGDTGKSVVCPDTASLCYSFYNIREGEQRGGRGCYAEGQFGQGRSCTAGDCIYTKLGQVCCCKGDLCNQ